MSRALLLLACLSLPAVAAKPSFTELVKRLPSLTLPLDSKRLGEGVELSVDEIPALGVIGRPEKSLGPLRLWEPEPEGGTVERVHAVGAIRRGDVVVLVVRHSTVFEMGTYAAVYLFTYTAKGALIDGLELGVDANSEAGAERTDGTLAADGTVARRTDRKIPMMEEGLPEQLVVTSELKAQLRSSGKFQASPETFVSKDGAFIDRTSKEELRVFGDAVFYRGNEKKPFQKLLREGDTVRFKAGGKPYGLSWDDARGVVTCKNPDGTKQTFTREW